MILQQQQQPQQMTMTKIPWLMMSSQNNSRLAWLSS